MSAEKEAELKEWLIGRPEVIKKMAGQLKPWINYRIKQTGQHCTLEAYAEDGTVRVVVNGHDYEPQNGINKLYRFDVFGIKPSDLEPVGEQ